MTETEIGVEEILDLVRGRAENFYHSRGLCCSQAVLLAINGGFRGHLSEELAIRIGAGFCGGIGEAGCVCGGLAGAVMALGLFLSPDAPHGLREKKFRKLSKKLHDSFQEQAGSLCCRVLIEDYQNDKKGQKKYCRGLTGFAAELVAGLLLDVRPELVEQVDLEFMRQRDSLLVGLIKKMN